MKEKIVGFVTDVAKEMSKVTWPKKGELRDSTIIVLTVCGVIAIFVYIVDTAISKIMNALL